MAFKFKWLCELLEDLDKNRLRKAVHGARSLDLDDKVVVLWFNQHSHRITRHGEEAIAFLSCVFPERRPDRNFNLQRKRLAALIGRSLLLPSTRLAQLHRWQDRDGVDLPESVAAVMAQAEFDRPEPANEVTLAEIDDALNEIAARSPFSSPAIRQRHSPRDPHDVLTPIFRRLQSWEARWLVRMILRSFSPVVIPEYPAMREFHFLLYDLLKFQDSFEAVVKFFGRAEIRSVPARPSADNAKILKKSLASHFMPQTGVMIRRAPYFKARSVKHCCDMVGRKRFSLERKYDGEYAQIHIDLSKGRDCIQIFSKSGKDSTTDRVRLHGAIRDSLRLGGPDSKIQNKCILEGELVVWSDQTKSIQPFYKLRKHVQRGGRWLNNLVDSPTDNSEHLMIIYYDILLLDDIPCAKDGHRGRRRLLERLIERIPGRVDIGMSEVVDFSSRKGSKTVLEAFAHGISQGWEGFVLKGSEDPYISLVRDCAYIKLKKDYIAGLGDSADLCVVGGCRDARVATEIGIDKLSWTSFHVGCLENKDEVCRFKAVPKFRIVSILSPPVIPREEMMFLNQHGKFVEMPFATQSEHLVVKIDQIDMPRPSELFKHPFITEVIGTGFDKAPNVSYMILRHPRIIKIHSDRSLTESISFDELQRLAACTRDPEMAAELREEEEWIVKLAKANGKSQYILDKSQETTPSKSPGSAKASNSSVRRSPGSSSIPRPPVLVRVDTSELSPSERAERQAVAKARERGSPIRTVRSNSSKRRAAAVDNDKLVQSRKRVKLTSTANTESQPTIARTTQNVGLSPKSGPSRSATAVLALPSTSKPFYQTGIMFRRQSRDGEEVTYLKKTPPWCFPRDSDTNTKPSSNSGEVLSEIINLPPQKTCKNPPLQVSKSQAVPKPPSTRPLAPVPASSAPPPQTIHTAPTPPNPYHEPKGNAFLVLPSLLADAAFTQLFPPLHTIDVCFTFSIPQFINLILTDLHSSSPSPSPTTSSSRDPLYLVLTSHSIPAARIAADLSALAIALKQGLNRTRGRINVGGGDPLEDGKALCIAAVDWPALTQLRRLGDLPNPRANVGDRVARYFLGGLAARLFPCGRWRVTGMWEREVVRGRKGVDWEGTIGGEEENLG